MKLKIGDRITMSFGDRDRGTVLGFEGGDVIVRWDRMPEHPCPYAPDLFALPANHTGRPVFRTLDAVERIAEAATRPEPGVGEA